MYKILKGLSGIRDRLQILNDRTEVVHPVDDERVVHTLSKALSNAIMMRADYSGKQVKFTEFRK